jgi:pyruvate-ferredoxin/flavodoxin oxidoreductase
MYVCPPCHSPPNRTSHEINKVSVLDPAGLKQLVDSVQPNIEAHRSRALNPNHPHQRGTSQGPDIYFRECTSSEV